MPRKRSVSGRAKVASAENRLRIQVSKINKRIRSLEKRGNFGVYAGRTLLDFASRNKYVSIRKARGSRRHRVLLNKLREATAGQLREIHKTFTHILGSKTFSNVGIERTRKDIRKKVKRTLQESYGTLTDEDVELFYEIAKYKEDDLIDQIGPSEFFYLVEYAREWKSDEDKFVSLLSQYAYINNDVMREKAKKLYYKYVR